MKTVQSDPDCPVFLLEKGEVVEVKGNFNEQVRPTEIYVLPHGSKNDEPSLVFIMASANGDKRYAQLSLAMASPAFAVAKALTTPPPTRFDNIFTVHPGDTTLSSNQVRRALHVIDTALTLEQVTRPAAAAAFRLLLTWLEDQGIGCAVAQTPEAARKEAAEKIEVMEAMQAKPDNTVH